MPYIRDLEREPLKELTDQIQKTVADGPSCTEGQLNYLMTRLAKAYVERCGTNYKTINAVMGVFSSAQAEFYRRVAVPYEMDKQATNGDV